METEPVICLKCDTLQATLNVKKNEIMQLKCNIQSLIKYIEENCKCNISQLEFFLAIKHYTEELCKDTETVASFTRNTLNLNSNSLNTDGSENIEISKQTQSTGSSNCFNETKEVKDEELFSKSENVHDYIFDEKYQMYYSLSTGYFYDDKRGLLYEPQSGMYYKYDYEQKEYHKVEYEESANMTNTITSICEAVTDKVNDLNLNDESQSDEVSKTETSMPLSSADVNKNSNKTSSVCNEDEALFNSAKDWQPKEGSNMTVADMVKQVVEEQSNMSDYIYDESYQMYYSPSTGYYYDSVRKLLYDPSNGIYYFYNAESETYEFYCQTNPVDGNVSSASKDCINRERLKSRKIYWKKKLNESKKSPTNLSDDNNNEKMPKSPEGEFSSPEDGEIFSSDDESNPSICITRSPVKKSFSDLCPPSIRAIVENSENLKIGSLILITYSGGTVGRDQTNAVCLPDICVSKIHAEIKFNSENHKYSIEDLGSQNGTFINDQRLSEPKEKSEPCILNHGDRLAFGSCKLLVHIHDGLETCDCCEPGQVLAETSLQIDKPIVCLSKEEKEKSRREELRRLKKKYGLQGVDFGRKSHVISKEYEDKAETRRQTVGSQNPYEKTEESSVDVALGETNKGYQMLKKMGWKEGQTLGTAKSALLEPIPIRPWVSKAGLGSCHELPTIEDNQESKRKKKWVKAQERYFQLSFKNSP